MQWWSVVRDTESGQFFAGLPLFFSRNVSLSQIGASNADATGGGRLPEQLKAELDLARCGGRAGNHAGRWRNARGSEDHGIGLVEIRPVEKVEYLRAKLKIQTLTNPRVLQHGEIPRGQTRPDQGVSPNVSIESAICRLVRRCQKRIGVKPLVWIAKDHGPRKSGIRERAHGISSVPVV